VQALNVLSKITSEDILNGLSKLGIFGERVEVHSSLRSFGYVEGGAETIVNVLISNFKTVMMPAFCWESNTQPPFDDRPVQNGCDYKFYDNWSKPKKPFIVENAGIEKSMGVVSREFIKHPEVKRSYHAWHSWAVWGDKRDFLISEHSWNTTNLPIERLAMLGGYVLLIGVSFSSCTAIHVAEEIAGRRPLIRWAIDKYGDRRRVRACGCAKGFDKLMPFCSDLINEIWIGKCRVISAKLTPLIGRCAEVLKEKPELIICSETCLRCRDMAKGGPRV
jgi:aminoglycoside 3-N-acetyltransferase